MNTNNVSEIKKFKTRDSATSALRKLGIASENYNLFIEKLPSGTISCDIGKAKASLVAPSKSESSSTTKSGDGKKTQRGVSAAIVKMILAGKSNEEIWNSVKVEFNLDDSKKYYPAWNRSNLRRLGKIS